MRVVERFFFRDDERMSSRRDQPDSRQSLSSASMACLSDLETRRDFTRPSLKLGPIGFGGGGVMMSRAQQSRLNDRRALAGRGVSFESAAWRSTRSASLQSFDSLRSHTTSRSYAGDDWARMSHD